MADKQQLHNLVDQLPESEMFAAARYLEFPLAREAPVDADDLWLPSVHSKRTARPTQGKSRPSPSRRQSPLSRRRSALITPPTFGSSTS